MSNSNSQKKVPFLSKPVKYTQKVELIQKVLGLYSVIFEPLTNRDIDLLTLCFLYDLNDDDFPKKVINAGIGVKTAENVHTMKSRLKKRGLIIQDEVYNRKYLSPSLQKLKDVVMKNDSFHISYNFLKDE